MGEDVMEHRDPHMTQKEFDAIIAWLDAWNRKQRRKEVFAWWYALKSWWANWS